MILGNMGGSVRFGSVRMKLDNFLSKDIHICLCVEFVNMNISVCNELMKFR